ncbi:MarR family winged helix-turn-helix transcriptional regulator [Streptomyces acidiscabies]|uniref:MarR family transcriptional regulator n=1 Tax=Streptomyces acidiscabies TaxID=42234 RepID=A0A0L0JG17_9ACTN|nr:MarR family winged helix-turn-helix transcriptional regulator [Streptomyces acidiscabies]KND24662.1 MarR family transcriptional regulator [Streptomyces acidiscabies]MBZ3916435.1 winged helix-turn-helix transcriptional regulator [Streptomyces acidiscabies]MDX2961192.1 MarR family winged helix-turn-helix transcriptional regulator [Streptomyces acidiscabies]MDX3022854.1 MarR family winged helix-turn-helix transcriptional regulator [Streptomyces acidiscabies]MDX3791899.1 MarR family winged heli
MLESVRQTARPGTDPEEPAITSPHDTASPAQIDADEPWMRGLHADTGYLLYRLGLRSGQLFNTFLQESGVRLRHYAVLRYLAGCEGALQRELSARLGYDPSAIVGLVDDLERLTFAERRPSPDDRRSRTVVLTEAGRAFLRDTDEAGLRVTNELTGPLTSAEREVLHGLLLRMAGEDVA